MINESCAKIGRKMKAYRNERGLSQQELAEGICSSSTISLIETGQHFPAVEIMQKLTEKLGVPLQEILSEEENNLELNIQIDITKIYVETKQFAKALEVIHEVEKEKELREFQKRELILYRAECLMQTGEAQQAINILSDLQQKLEQLRENDDSLMARVYDKLGTAYYFASNFTNAHAHYFRAYQLTTRFPQFDVVAAKIVYNLGMVCRQLNRFREAIEFLTQAESFFKDHQDQKRLAQTYLELGISYKGSQHFELADHYLKESLALLRAMNVVKMCRRVRRSHALVVLSQTNPELAIEELMSCALEYEQESDFVRSANTNAHLARVLLSEGKSTEAGVYLQKAISQLKN